MSISVNDENDVKKVVKNIVDPKDYSCTEENFKTVGRFYSTI
jgi:hypothetical protein